MAMLIKEEMENMAFSPAESTTVTYLLKYVDQIENMSVQELAKETYTHPSTIIRIAKKLGFKGWVDFKRAYMQEHQYLTNSFTMVDTNIPFSKTDHVMSIAHKIGNLEKNTIDDLLSLLHYDDLALAKQLMSKASCIYIFGQNANLLLAEDFALKMRRIGKTVHISKISGEERYEAHNIPKDTLAILISTSGETDLILEINQILRRKGIQQIAITSIGNNSLSQNVNLFLPISTREKLYSKIGNFTTNISIHVLLDILYSLNFSVNYEEHLNHLKKTGQLVDKRNSSTGLMKEN